MGRGNVRVNLWDCRSPALQTPEKSVPPTCHQRGTKETPAKPRSIHSSSYWEGTLDERRLTVLEELSFTIPEVPLILFLESLLPPLNNGIDIDAILESLKDQEIIAANGRWAAFPQDPRSLKGENTIFSPLEDIFSKAVETAIQQASALNPMFVLRLLPNAVPESERGSTTRPDGFAVVKETEDRNQEGNAVVYRWYDIALTCEFKLLDTDAKRDDNVTKIVYSMQHTMTLDLCKRFTFGITIEDTNMRLWFSSRAVMAVSEPSNFITQPELLIHVFLSLAFASKVELGIVFEETATPVWAVTSLSDAFIVLRDCVTALKYIHKSGYVHRDISAGNVFYYEGRGLIGDLEYAKEVATDGTHQMRTGTPDFKAVEVMRQEFLYRPQQGSSQIIEEDIDEWLRGERLQEHLKAVRNALRLPFVQNEGHDIESSWWIAIYILFFNADETLSKEEIKNCQHSRQVWT
ncbi:hypothetical protein ACEPAI_3352 [Sanghuangporus weigelae]